MLSTFSLIFATVVAGGVASSASSGAAIGSKYPLLNFTQQLDHKANCTARMFNQRYQVIHDFFKPGGPIFFTQGGESNLTPVENSNFFDMARELGGLVVTLEHRFFGTSFPDNFEASVSSYSPLTLDNILDDAVSFIQFIQKNATGAENSKVIAAGGSYPANLAIAMRIKRPDTFYGAFPSGAFTTSFGPLASNPAKYKAAEALSNMYYDLSSEASNKIQQSMMRFHNCALVGKNCTKDLLQEMRLCDKGRAPNATEFAIMYSASLNTYRYAPQFNYPFPASYAMPYPFKYLVNETLNATSAGEVVRIPLAMLNAEPTSNCIDWTSKNITQLVNAPVGASWSYILCQFYAISETAVPSGNLLPPTDPSARIEICQHPEYEGSLYNQTNEAYQDYLGTKTEVLDKTKRLVMFQGGYDRVSGVGVPVLTLSDDREHSRVVVTPGIGHTEDTIPESVIPRGVIPQLDAVRDMKVEYVREWLRLDGPE